MASADDLRIFFALAREGRVVRAAASLEVDHTTVSRRISRLERELGHRLFERSPNGWTLTEEGKLLLVPAEAIEDAMRNWDDLLAAQGGSLMGPVRIVCPDSLGTYLVAPALPRLVGDGSGMTVELFTTTQSIDARLRDFDITVTMERPTGARVTSWHLSEYRVGLYASRDYLASVPPIRTIDDLRTHPYVGFVDRILDVPPLQDLQNALQKPPEIQCSTVALQVQAIANGAGVGQLATFVEGADPRLVRILPGEEYRRDYWITVANTAQRLGRIQKVVRLLTSLVEENRSALRGE